ncbi:MAG: TraB/GumN family protein, partial [Cyanobacteria bacterium P01_F01_bin.86]
ASFTVATCSSKIGKSEEGNVFLWEIESPSNTVYLLGSIHMLRETDYPLSRPIQAAFEEAENVVFEIDLGAAQGTNMLAVLEAANPDIPGESLADALSPETYELAAEAAASVGLPIAGFNRFEPWFFFISLQGLKLAELGFEPDYGVDFHFYNEAQVSEREILALETLEEQLGFFDDLSPQIQADMLEQTILELDLLESSLDAMVAAWKSGDVNSFESLIFEGFADYPEVYEVLLTRRNQNWLEDIESFINQSEDYLVIVGAAHLVGNDSLVNLLQERGYEVEQLNSRTR